MIDVNEETTLVWGAGAIGSTIGAHLVRAGRKVAFVDVNEPHLECIRNGRLRIDGPVAQMTVGAAAGRPEHIAGRTRLLLFAIRLFDAPSALPMALEHLAGDGIIVSCQNGLGALDVAQAAGAHRTVAASFFMPADVNGPGHVTYGSRARMTVGRVASGDLPDLSRVLAVLRDFEPGVHDSDDILSVIWTKMAYGAMLTAVAMDDGLTAAFLKSERLRPILVKLMREVVLVARASGHPAEDADWFAPNLFLSDDPRDHQRCVDSVLDVLKTSTKQHSGPWQSIVLHKRRTEIVPQFTPMVALAEKYGIDVPVTRRLLALIDELETRRRAVGKETMDLLLASALASDAPLR